MNVMIGENGFLPVRGTAESAGYDLFSPYEEIIPANSTLTIKLDIYIQLEPGTYGQLHMRSSLARDAGLTVLGGVIDSDYRGEIQVMIRNLNASPYVVKKAQKIAQIVINRIATPPSIRYNYLAGMNDEFMYPSVPCSSIPLRNKLLEELLNKLNLLFGNNDCYSVSSLQVPQNIIDKFKTKSRWFETQNNKTLLYHFPTERRNGGFGSTGR